MSEEQLKAFLEAVKADAGLQEKLKAAGEADAVVAIARAAGFMISAEELRRRRAQAEISEEELGVVVGGLLWDAQQTLQHIYPKNEKFNKN
jgi:predicted ribosomally synthesized peptide with nif11-like leader